MSFNIFLITVFISITALADWSFEYQVIRSEDEGAQIYLNSVKGLDPKFGGKFSWMLADVLNGMNPHDGFIRFDNGIKALEEIAGDAAIFQISETREDIRVTADKEVPAEKLQEAAVEIDRRLTNTMLKGHIILKEPLKETNMAVVGKLKAIKARHIVGEYLTYGPASLKDVLRNITPNSEIAFIQASPLN